MKSPPSYQESNNNKFKHEQINMNNSQQEQYRKNQNKPDLINESNLNSNKTGLNFRQYFENLKQSKKRDTPIQDDNPSSSSSYSAHLNPSYEDLEEYNYNQALTQQQLDQQKHRHKLIKFSNSISKLQDDSNQPIHNLSSTNHLSPSKLKQKQKEQLKFTTEIEKELSNLTLTIEKEMEKQKLAKQQRQYQQINQQQQQNEYYGNCSKCSKPVFDREEAVLAMNNIYHSCCFTCNSCGRQLRNKSFYYLNNNVYCEEDYLYSGFLENAEKCSICGHIIVDMILQAMGKAYHPGCFRCYSCNECLDGLPFTLDINNHVFCIKDFYRLYAPKCASCGLAITPVDGTNETVRVVSMEKDFHIECYICEDCGCQLTDEQDKRCYPIGKSLFCYKCHLKRLELNQLDQVLLNNLNNSSNLINANNNNKFLNNSFNNNTSLQGLLRSNYHYQVNGNNEIILNNTTKRNLHTENI